MKLENQVCTKDQAAKLKELGVIQKSLFYYHPAFERVVFGETHVTETGKQYKKIQVCNDKKGAAAAFTVAELGLMLPAGYDTMYNTGLGWCGYDLDDEHVLQSFLTEAECRAAMLIELIQRKEVTAEYVNEMLCA